MAGAGRPHTCVASCRNPEKWNAGTVNVGSVEPKGPRPEVPFEIGMRMGKEMGIVSEERRMKEVVKTRR